MRERVRKKIGLINILIEGKSGEMSRIWRDKPRRWSPTAAEETCSARVTYSSPSASPGVAGVKVRTSKSFSCAKDSQRKDLID